MPYQKWLIIYDQCFYELGEGYGAALLENDSRVESKVEDIVDLRI